VGALAAVVDAIGPGNGLTATQSKAIAELRTNLASFLTQLRRRYRDRAAPTSEITAGEVSSATTLGVSGRDRRRVRTAPLRRLWGSTSQLRDTNGRWGRMMVDRASGAFVGELHGRLSAYDGAR
jgi:hypothetical protein